MSNEHIKKFLDEYLAKPSNDYAVLITGCWGSGKTHFISRYMGGQKVHKVRDWLMDSVNRTVVYISLFGVKSRKDIETKREKCTWNTRKIYRSSNKKRRYRR